MIFKQTWLNVADNTNVRWIKVFHLYKGFYRKSTHSGMFVKSSARIVEPPRIEYKGFKFKFNKKGDICRGFIIRTTYNNNYYDGGVQYFYSNDCVLIKKKQDFKSKYLYGPVTRHLKRKKLINLFKLKI